MLSRPLNHSTPIACVGVSDWRNKSFVARAVRDFRRGSRVASCSTIWLAAAPDTAIGDAVNTAARIEELTKVHGTSILVSEETRRQIGGAVRFAAAGPAHVKGKSEPVRAYVPMLD